MPRRPPPRPALPDGLNERERLSYALGVNLGRSLLADGLDPEPTLLIAGLSDTLADRPQRMTDEEVAALLAAAAEKVREAAAIARQKDDERRAAVSRHEFEKFVQGEGAARFAPGVWAKVTEPGDGPKPAADGRVTLHYTASVAGEPERPIFTTAGRDPVTVPVASLLPGLKAVLPTLPVGTAATLALAPAAAYGPAGGPRRPAERGPVRDGRTARRPPARRRDRRGARRRGGPVSPPPDDDTDFPDPDDWAKDPAEREREREAREAAASPAPADDPFDIPTDDPFAEDGADADPFDDGDGAEDETGLPVRL